MVDEQGSAVESREARRDDRDRRRRNVRLGFMAALAAVVVLLGVDNNHDVQVEYLVGESNIALVWVILASLVTGAVFERAYGFVRGRRRED